MKFQKQNTPISFAQPDTNSAGALSACPLLNIPVIDDHGLVMETRCGFEVGSTIVLGFHLRCDGSQASRHRVKPGTMPQKFAQKSAQVQGLELSSSTTTGQSGSVFISLEVIVVESKIGHGSAGQPVYLVTVLFSGISRKDRKSLLSYTGSGMQDLPESNPLDSAFCPTLSAGKKKFLSEVIRRIGLN